MSARLLVFAACSFGLAMTILAMSADAMDFAVYRAGGAAVWHGLPLYESALWRDLPFTYPPFAAILFVPLALTGPALAAVGNSAVLVYVAAWCWRSVGNAPKVLALVTASVLMATEAVHATLYLGQINFVLLALVLGDLLRHDSRFKGVWLGIAAGIKLTPLIFIPYLLVTRRFRAAAVATTTFTLTVGAGFALLPRDSAMYWFAGTFGDATRVYSDLSSTHNQSLRGLLLRSGFDDPYWVLGGVLILGATLVVAAKASKRGEELLALTLVGLCGSALSPWSWGHHWSWLVPLSVFLVARVRFYRPLWVPLALLPFTFPWVLALADPPDSAGHGPVLTGLAGFVVGNLYLLIFLTVLVVSACYLRRSGTSQEASSCSISSWRRLVAVPASSVSQSESALSRARRAAAGSLL